MESQLQVPQQLVELHGWGRAAGSRSHLARIDTIAGAVSALRNAGDRGVVPRGLGRSYGDAAQNAGGTTLDLTRLNKILQVDAEGDAPTVSVQSGVSIDALMKALLPFGLWVPVLPGTRQVTIGGAIAADVHGKNHHTQGSFGNHVRDLDLLTADGEIRTIGPDGDDPELFWATVGGMGLTGVILRATVVVQRTETAYFTVDTQRCGDLDELMATMTDGDENYTYSVAWFDAVTRGKHLGRAVLTRGNKAKLSDLPAKLRTDPLRFAAPSFGTIPEVFPNRMVNLATAKAFSAMWFRKAPKHRVGEVQNITTFFHPLDIVAEWNRVYGPNGFLQYQFVGPLRRARDVPAVRGDDRHLGPPVLPQRAQAVRSRQRRAAVLPDAGLDADRRPAHRGRAGPALHEPRRTGRGGGRPLLPGQGLPVGRGDVPPDVPPARRLPRRPEAGRPDAGVHLRSVAAAGPVSSGPSARPPDHRPRSLDR